MLVNKYEFSFGVNNMAYSTPSHRSEKRAPTDRIGTIKLSLFKTITCDVSDLSASGAKITTEDGITLPSKFELKLSGTGKKRSHKCVTRWQKENVFGVEFTSTKIG